MNSEIQKRVAQQLQELRGQIEIKAKRIEKGEQILPGDLFNFKLPKVVPVNFCSTFTHPDDKQLWYVVPCDDFSLVGTKDVVLPESDGGSRLRCAMGTWVHEDDFCDSVRVGHLKADYVSQVRERLARMLEDDLPDVQYLRDNDNHPDYREWMQELGEAMAAFDQQLVTEDAETNPRAEYDWTNTESAEIAYADSSGVGKLPELDSEFAELRSAVAFDGPGELFVLQTERDIEFHIHGPKSVEDLSLIHI